MGSCGTRPSTALSAAQRRLIIITAPASIMKVRARAYVHACARICMCVHARESARACVYYVGVESARVRRLVAFGHRRRTGSDGKNKRRCEERQRGTTMRVASRRIRRVSAPLSHALKRNAWGLREGRTEGSGRRRRRRPRELRAGIFIFSVCAGPGGTRARFPKDRTF